LPAVVALLKRAGLPVADLTSIAGLQLWVLEGTDGVVGAIAMERCGSQALLRSLAVAPEYRNCGFGRELVARLEEAARTDELTQLVLLTQTAETFFRSLGYEVTDRNEVSDTLKQSAEFRSLCPASAVCMSKRLPHRQLKERADD
jgi:amino-acid N-acetyltransferase